MNFGEFNTKASSFYVQTIDGVLINNCCEVDDLFDNDEDDSFNFVYTPEDTKITPFSISNQAEISFDEMTGELLVTDTTGNERKLIFVRTLQMTGQIFNNLF